MGKLLIGTSWIQSEDFYHMKKRQKEVDEHFYHSLISSIFSNNHDIVQLSTNMTHDHVFETKITNY